MITSDIQELFDGTLGDDQVAELFHALSVSPERRVDFQRHVALQGAMQVDRMDSRLSSDEDAAIWGAIGGLSAAGTAAGGGIAAGWLVKPFMFILAGVIGYVLGTTTFSSSTGDGGSSAGSGRSPAGASPLMLMAVQGIVVPIPFQDHLLAPAAVALVDSRRPSSIAYADRPRVNGARNARVIAADNGPVTDLRNDRALRSGDQVPATSSSSSTTIQNDGGSLRSTIDNQVPHNWLRNGGAARATSTVSHDTAGAPMHTPATSPNDNNAHPRSADSSGNSASMTPKTSTPSSTANDANLALGAHRDELPPTSDALQVGVFSHNGFEGGFVQRLTSSTVTNSAGSSSMFLSNNSVSASYQFLDGRVGIGARLGYGAALQANYDRDSSGTEARGAFSGSGTNYDFKGSVGTHQVVMVELFGNYRLPISNGIMLNAEGSVGGTSDYLKAGGGLSVLFLLSDRIAIQAGADANWYSYNATGPDAKELLRNAPSGTSILSAAPSFGSFLVEGKYGVVLRF